MGGDVGVDSEPGKGSTFWFTARLGRGAGLKRNLLHDPDLRGRHTLVVDDNPSSDLSSITGARILLVEDNDLNQEVAIELLNDAGFTVELAENGAIALEMIARQSSEKPYDIVLMDMQMPVMDGLTATLEIRKQSQWAELPIVAMTANAMAGDRDRCLAAGMNDHVAKPIDPVDLWAKLLRWIKCRNPAAAQAEQGETAKLSGTPSASSFAAIPGLDVARGVRLAMGRDQQYDSLIAFLFPEVWGTLSGSSNGG